jgi:plastocyanin
MSSLQWGSFMLSVSSPIVRRAPRLAAAVLATVAGLAPLALPPPAAAATHAVEVGDGSFSPASLTVSVGDTVTWTNADDSPHTVTAEGAFDSGNLEPGQTFSFTFAEAGTYTYVCQYHDEMVATITVAAPGSGAAAATPAPAAPATSAAQAAEVSAADAIQGSHEGDQPDTALHFGDASGIPAWLAPLLIGLGLMAFAVAVIPSLSGRSRAEVAPGAGRPSAGGWRR